MSWAAEVPGGFVWFHGQGVWDADAETWKKVAKRLSADPTVSGGPMLPTFTHGWPAKTTSEGLFAALVALWGGEVKPGPGCPVDDVIPPVPPGAVS